jgi:hypothetical protein
MPIFNCRLNLAIAPVCLLVLLLLGPLDALAQGQPLLNPSPAATDSSVVNTVGDTRAVAANNTAGDASAASASDIGSGSSNISGTNISGTSNIGDTNTAGNASTASDSQVAPLRPGLTTNPPVTTNSPSSSPSDGQDAAKPAAATSSAGSGSKKSSMGQLLKSNVVQTFQLDPRLKSDLMQGNDLFRPIHLLEDYVAVGYNPVIQWQRTGGAPWQTSYQKTNMAVYMVGPLTKHLSMWIQPLPLVNTPGFFSHSELFQGLLNYGTDKTLVQLQGGQGFNFENSGWGGADRAITQTFPGVYTPFNGFDPTSVTKTISLSATALNWTTGKVFGYWQPGAQTSSDPNITYNRGYGMGLTFEKLIGKTGISGIQSNLTMGNNPAYNANTNANTGNIIGGQNAHFVNWTSWINKSFQDKQGYVRLNPSFGFNVFHQRSYLDNASVPELPSTGYGYTFDLLAIPVRSYWTTVIRYDQYKPTRLASNNTTYTFSIGQALDFHLPKKARLRVTLDYQLIGQHTAVPSHAIYLGFWPIW